MAENQSDHQYAPQHEENPLEQGQPQSIMATPTHLQQDSMQHLRIQDPTDHSHDDEPPPPYEEVRTAGAPQICAIEYSSENSRQLVDYPQEGVEGIVPPPHNPNRLSANTSPHPGPPSPTNSGALPSTLRSHSSSCSQYASPVQTTTPSSSAKAREAGFDIRPYTHRSNSTVSTSSDPSINIVNSHEPLHHTREAGKLTAYLIPFPKPRLLGVDPQKIPNRFLVYTPPTPPLSKPAPGEKESQWHKTQRRWQEDVRKATINDASIVTWKGFKAKTTRAVGKGVSLTKTTNLEFLDRVSQGAIESSVLDSTPSTSDLASSQSPNPPSALPSAISVMTTGIDYNPPSPTRSNTSLSTSTTDSKPKPLSDLTLIYPPSVPLTPSEIRSEFTSSLLRTRTKSQRDAILASSLLPFAAAVDFSLLLTLGGLTEVSAVWAHSSIRGAITSKAMTQGLKAGEMTPQVRGCMCGEHEGEFGAVQVVEDKKEKRITLSMQANAQIEVLSRYLDGMCLQREYAMFPQLDGRDLDVSEEAVLEAIGWQPKRRLGYELELEDSKGLVEKLTPEQDEAWQMTEAKADVRRIMKKGAGEWVSWCKMYRKDAEAALKK